MANDLDRSSATRIVTLLEFSWGEVRNYARYCRGQESVTIQGNGFSPLPSIEVDYGEQHGGTQDVAASIVVPEGTYPINRMIGNRFWPTECRVIEVDPTDDDSIAATYRVTWFGEVDQTTLNPSGRRGLIASTIPGIKFGMRSRLGLQVLSFCPFRFGGPGCRVDLAPYRSVATLSSASGNVATISGLPQAGTARWINGTVEFNGLELSIVAASGDDYTLESAPPPEMIGQACVCTFGCDRTANGCYDRSRFGGFGIAMPASNPLFEP